MEILLNTKEEKATESRKMDESEMQFSKTFSKDYILCNSVYIIVSKWQNCDDKDQISGCQGLKVSCDYEEHKGHWGWGLKLFCILVVVEAAWISENWTNISIYAKILRVVKSNFTVYTIKGKIYIIF